MSTFFVGMIVIVAALTAVNLYRVILGPTVYDRVIGAGLIGTNAIILLVLAGFVYERIDLFIDLAVTYAMLNFIGVVAVGKYLERRGEKSSQ